MNIPDTSTRVVATGRPPGLRAGALLLFAASCVPMLVMLPASLTGLLATVGIEAEAGWVHTLARPLEPVAQPLLIVSALLLGAASARCGWAPLAAALGGGTLLYLGMYVVTGPGGQTQPALFYSGLALFLGNPILTLARPRLRACRPLIHGPRATRLLVGTLGVGAILLALGPAVGWGRATAALHARHSSAGTASESQTGATASAPVVSVEQDSFLWSGSVEGYTAGDAWFPPISTDGALLAISGGIRSGEVFVQLMDGQALIVYEETLSSIPARGLEVEVPGARGVWMVTLGFEGFTADLEVKLGPG